LKHGAIKVIYNLQFTIAGQGTNRNPDKLSGVNKKVVNTPSVACTLEFIYNWQIYTRWLIGITIDEQVPLL